MSVYDLQGQLIQRVQITDPSGVTEFLGPFDKVCPVIPDTDKLFNFSIFPTPEREFLVLDPYGDENHLPETVRERLFSEATDGVDFTVALELETGCIYHALFYTENSMLTLALTAPQSEGGCEGPIRLPRGYRKGQCGKLATWLRSCKRPFQWTLTPQAMSYFIDREIGYKDLASALMLELSLPRGRLLLTYGMWATQSDWSEV